MNAWFEKLNETFILSGGYRYIIEGFRNTVVITLGALLIGVVIGSLIAIIKYFAEESPRLKPLAWLCDLTVTIGENTYQSAFFPARLEEADMYTVFLDGNQAMVRIRNEANTGKGKLLVIRDSYANCIGPMLAESYEEVIMMDLRYYKLSISALCRSEGISNVLIMYSLSNFMTDSNFPFLR